MNGTKTQSENPDLLAHFFTLLTHFRPLFRQERVYNRVVALALAELFKFGRGTVTQLLLTLGLTDSDWSAWYRLFSEGRFDPLLVAEKMLKLVVAEVPAAAPFVTACDGFHIPRTSKKMPGTNWAKASGTASFKPGLQRAQRFVEGSWLTPMVNGFSRAVPLRCLAAFAAKAVPSAEPWQSEAQAGVAYLQWLRQGLDQLGRQQQQILALADGRYDTHEMWAGLPEGVALLVRTARNRILFHLPERQAGVGRPRLYGERAPSLTTWIRQHQRHKRRQVMIRGHKRTIKYQVQGPFIRAGLPHIPVFLIVVGGGKRPKGARRTRYEARGYLVSAVQKDGKWCLPLPIADLLAWIWQRWELEVAHRELKSGLGLGEKQCWHPLGTIVAVQWTVWVYSLMVLAGYRTWGLLAGPEPPGRWYRRHKRWSFNILWRSFRAALWQRTEFRASWTPSAANWPKKEAMLASLGNAVLAAQRA